ncbi:MarR family winged helix-turn-helix transcriptional regulator [Paenibacillus apiarius]|uniref:MarR family transcriptional regulator n=1 Tax=Paenibacillus apiarius TaxID=46240 RepID=A0ABT4DSH1_9BACL|nr:MarR family transcriptional regulator [Paenibacillus apiarius]MBN3525269.1 MarR family transcriptional regulator [Paenibacillus apiarius]MCY9512987.1 MarR family transcriptional regulator [Paenibacillus apiarius]MCY9518971.1 MarR family transcriptional regulator [Paenibacillus apiarius]MCY9550780.1 MarR family transcriptional regulator [Paenibacillus apiarius]MCY9559786.1 MarR family transcriptional regulator [Paenibacillus apiarius]
MYDEYRRVMDRINEQFERFKMNITSGSPEVERLNDFKLTPQQELIMFHIIRSQPITAHMIAAYMNVTKSAVSQTMAKLESRDMIVRDPNPRNRREALIRLGKRGEEYRAVLEDIDEMLVRKYYSKVELRELQQVLDTLTKLNGLLGDESGKTRSKEEDK